MAKAKYCILLLIVSISSLFADRAIKIQEVPKIMEQLFTYHIENKELKPTIVRRSFKIYIEHFDPDKTYLLQKEVAPYLAISDEKAKMIAERMRKGDFSDFYQLNTVIKQAIARSQKWRENFKDEFLSENTFAENDPGSSSSLHAVDDWDLSVRQRNRIARFFLFHQKKTPITTEDRKLKLFALLDRKLQRSENPYLLLDAQGAPLTKEGSDHAMALRILKAFSKSLDAHTSFFSEEEAYEMRMNLEKQFEGLGVVLSEGVDGVIISEIMEGSPAAKSGKIKVNDILVEINGTRLANISFETVLQLLKKKDKAEYVLGIERISFDANENMKKQFWRVSLNKAPIVMENDRITYTYEPYGNGIIAKITLNSFYENGNGINSEKDLKEAIKALRQHGPIRGLVLDFRENAGGFLSQAVKVAGLFISSGVVVVSKYGKGEVHYLRSLDPKTYYNGPLVILTSKLSASAAEIVAQALQDYGAALIVGDERTFGKGSIQFQTVTDEKADLFYKVTVGKYYTVSGKSTQIEGVQADILVPTLFAPFNIGERYLEYPLPADKIPSAFADSLSDLEEGKTKRWFQRNYLPFLQKKITFWRKMLPELRKNSEKRILADRRFQQFLRLQEKIKAKINGKDVLWDDLKNFSLEDLQAQEAANILKDMIYLEGQARETMGLSYTTEDESDAAEKAS